MAQSVKCPFQLRSGHDLTVRGLEPSMDLSAVRTEPASDPLSPSLSLPLPCLLPSSPSVKNKVNIKN